MHKRRPNSDALDAAFDRLAEAAVGDVTYPPGTVFIAEDLPYASVVVASRAVSGAPVALVRSDGQMDLVVALATTSGIATMGVENDFHVTQSSGGFVRTVHPVLS